MSWRLRQTLRPGLTDLTDKLNNRIDPTMTRLRGQQ